MPQAAELLPESFAPPVQHHGAPMCRCGSRNSVRIGDSALLRMCNDCGFTFAYRVSDGRVVPLDPIVAMELDRERASTWSLERMTGFLRRAGAAR